MSVNVQLHVSKAQYAQVAQLVEQWTENPRVGGSNPPLGTTSTQQQQSLMSI